MSGISFLAPWWGLMGLLAIPIVLLYILRQKRPDLAVSSTILWSKALADMRASTPFQKLRRNLLLLLQLLILAALVITLMRPVMRAQANQAQAGVIVIDATASMQAQDGDEGGGAMTRLERAKVEAKTLVERMRPGDKFMLVADGGGMLQVRSGFTSSKAELKSLIDSVKPSDTASDLSESLLLAATSLRAIGSGADGDAAKKGAEIPGKIWLFSDGSNIHVPDAMGGGNGKAGDLLNFVRIGASDHSVGITRLSITPVPKREKTYQVFVGLKNAWRVEKKVGVVLAFGTKDNFLPGQAKFATLPAGATGSVVFEEVVAEPGKIFVRVDDKDDDFPLDNTAYGIVAPPRKLKIVLVTPGNQLLENLVNTAVKVGAAEGQIIAPEFYNAQAPADLFILDGFMPAADKLPKVDTMLVRPELKGAKPGTLDVAGFKVSNVIERPAVLRWKREDPLMQYVELGELRIGKALLMDKDPGAVELVSAPEGPLIAYKDFGSVRRYFLSFSPLLESNWWQLPSLIIFMQNVIEQTRERHFIGMPQVVAAGTPAKLWAPESGRGEEGKEEKVRVTMPDGSVAEVMAKEGTTEFGATDKVGFYEVAWPAGAAGKEEKTLFAVNLLSPAESDIRPQSLQAGEGNAVAESTSVASVNKEVWQWLAVAALVILTLEWWAYHRRVA